MPRYDFTCKVCDIHIEIEKSISDPHPELCNCGGELVRVFTPVGVQFKGSGFYRTDNRGR